MYECVEATRGFYYVSLCMNVSLSVCFCEFRWLEKILDVWSELSWSIQFNNSLPPRQCSFPSGSWATTGDVLPEAMIRENLKERKKKELDEIIGISFQLPGPHGQLTYYKHRYYC